MNLFATILLCLPILFLVTLFVGIVKKRKRLWVTSLIFLILVSFFDITYFSFSTGSQNTTVTIQNSNTDNK